MLVSIKKGRVYPWNTLATELKVFLCRAMFPSPSDFSLKKLSLFRFGEYAMALSGPIGIAFSQFVMALQLLHGLSASEFGSFSFLLVASQLAAGFWSALFCAPLPVVLLDREDRRAVMVKMIFTASLFLAVAALFLFLAIGIALNLTIPVSLVFAVYVMFSLLRWFARSHAYAFGRPLRTSMSDLLFAIILLIFVGQMVFVSAVSLQFAFTALMISTAIGLLPFGGSYFRQQFIDLSVRDLGLYKDVWRRYSSWSVIGVATTEATANAHAYIVTFFAGPAAFAGLAASSLIIRPLTVVMNALTDFERPRLAALIADHDLHGLRRSLAFFRFGLISTWVGTIAAAALIARIAPDVMFPAKYDSQFILYGIVLWIVIAATRLSRTTESALLQGAGEFRWLAHASIISFGFSVVAVAAAFWFGGTLWSLLGVLLGEAIFAAWIWRQTGKWMGRYKSAL